MKKHLLILIALVLVGFASTSTAFGQRKVVKVNINFDFQIGKNEFPAGEYTIESLNSGSDNTFQIRSGKGKNQLLVTNLLNADKRQTPKLIFRRFGKQVFLAQIFFDSEPWGFSLPAAKSRRAVAANLAAAPPETIEVGLQTKH